MNDVEPTCALCAQNNAAVDEINPLLRELTQLRTTLMTLVNIQKQVASAHLRCALCGILAGPGHLVQELTPEPNVADESLAVCRVCADHLTRMGQTVVRQHAASHRVHALLATADADEAVA